MASGDLSRINTNIQAMNALNALNNVNSRMSVHQLRLATGKRINSAADDAAGFTIASKLKVKSEGLGTALDNIGSAKNLMTVAEGHMNNIKDILTEMKSKAQQAANGTIGSDERAAILSELQEFNNQIDAEVAQAQWAGVDILGTDKTFQIGVGTATADELTVNIAESVWGASTSTTFNSEGLDVVASSTVNATVTSSVLATLGVDTGGTVATTSAMDHAAGLAAGHYNIEASWTTNGTISVQVFDSSGSAVTLDADGDASTDATATTSPSLLPWAPERTWPPSIWAWVSLWISVPSVRPAADRPSFPWTTPRTTRFRTSLSPRPSWTRWTPPSTR
jgi:flagellin